METPQVLSLDKVYMPVVLVSGADGQTAEKTRGDSAGAVFEQVVHARRCGVWCLWPDSAENLWRFHRCQVRDVDRVGPCPFYVVAVLPDVQETV